MPTSSRTGPGPNRPGPNRPGPADPAGAPTESERILEAAWHVLRRSNWRGIKVNAVLVEARLPLRAFYRNFRSKDELLIAMMEQEVAAAERRFDAVLASATDPIERLRRWLTAELALAYAAEVHPRTRAFVRVWGPLQSELPEFFEKIMKRLMTPLRELLADGRESGQFPHAEPERDAVAIFLLTNAVMLEALDGRRWMTEAEANDLILRFVLPAVGAG